MAKQKDYYELLGIDRKATADQIRSAYRKMARRFHPDVNKESDAAKWFSEIQEAYDALSDAEKRSNYDRFGHAGVGAGTGGPAGGSWSGGFRPGAGGRATWTNAGGEDFDAGDVESIFEQMFGGGDGFGNARSGSPFGATGRVLPTASSSSPAM